MDPTDLVVPPIFDMTVDLANCDREPIHIPGRIQPRGVLLAIREPDLRVTQVSDNVGSVLGAEVAGVVGQPLSAVVGASVASKVERLIRSVVSVQEHNPIEALIEIDGRPLAFDVILHRAADEVVLVELEPAEDPRSFEFPNTYLAVRGAVSELNQALMLDDLYGITARVVRHLTGFDRVIVYRYDHDLNGEVVAEEKREDLESFLGLHYPASDIPAQARALYEKNSIRLISDVDYEPALIVPSLDPLSGQPLDLTMSTLRSVSPIHLEYLRNMGVRASMSISLLNRGTLWGLIACHHYSGPRAPTYAVRTAAEFLGSILSMRLVARAEEERLQAALTARAVLLKLMATRDDTETMVDALLGDPSLLDLFPADGVAVTAEGQAATQGVVPDQTTLVAIAEWAASVGSDLVATDSLAAAAPELNVPPGLASGVLALVLPKGESIMWFRGEHRHAVDWAGDPNGKSFLVVEGDDVRLSPRKSFERWQQAVELRSLPWTEDQCQLAEDLRAPVVEALYIRAQRRLRELADRQRAEAKFGSFLESAPDGVVLIEADGRIAQVNAQTERLFGYSRNDLLGQHVEMLLPRRFRDSHIAHRDGYIKEPHVRAMGAGIDLRGMRFDGSEFAIAVSLAPLHSEHRTLFAATVRDVTEQRRLEAVRDEFIHHAAHELRTPLATLAALGETLALHMGEMSPENVAAALGALKRQGERASTLVANLLDHSQLESGHANVQLAAVDVGQAMARVLEVAPAPDGTTVAIGLTDDFCVLADPVHLERLLTNLLTNAYRYGGNHVVLNAERVDANIVISVTDDGPGLPPELLDTVFEPFVRGNIAGRVGGSGVGLALCRRIAETFGGAIWYDDEHSAATFKVRLQESP